MDRFQRVDELLVQPELQEPQGTPDYFATQQRRAEKVPAQTLAAQRRLSGAPEPVDRAENAKNAFLRGAGQFASEIPKTLTELYALVRRNPDKEVKDYATFQLGKTIADTMGEAFPSDPRLQKELFSEIIPGMAGGFASLIAGGAASKALLGGEAPRR